MDIRLLIWTQQQPGPFTEYGPNGSGDPFDPVLDVATAMSRLEHRAGPALPTVETLEALEAAQGDQLAYDAEWQQTKQARNNLLAQTDWTRLDDNGLTQSQRAMWAEYRQTLRDLPHRWARAIAVVFPPPPTAAQLKLAKLADERNDNE